MGESLQTFHVDHVGGGIPSLEIAEAIARDVFAYGLWGHGYSLELADGSEVSGRRLGVTVEPGDDALLEVWLDGWRRPASSISIERRCVHCRQVLPP